MEAEPTWRCWHASVHTARFLYSSQSQTSCFVLATPKDRLWQVTTDASQYVRDGVRALTQEKDCYTCVYGQGKQSNLCDVQTGKLLLAEQVGAPKGTWWWEKIGDRRTNDISMLLNSLTKVLLSPKKLCILSENICILSQKYCISRETLRSLAKALRCSFFPLSAHIMLILFPSQKCIG